MNKKNTNPKYCEINDKRSYHSSKKLNTEINLELHWNSIYEKIPINELGWYEENSEPSLKLIKMCNLDKTASILNVGAGATTLIDELIRQGYENIIVNDISPTAIKILKERLIDKKIKWIIDDLTNPTKLNNLSYVDLWHDRAVLHFFNKKKEQDSYFNLINHLVKKNGFVIIAAFNLSSAKKCSGLPVHRYDKNMLKDKLSKDFELIEAFDYTYHMPSGDSREYIYTLFKRI